MTNLNRFVSRAAAFGAFALLGMANASAQTTLSGDYSNGIEYQATLAGSPYTVTPTATFNNNFINGLEILSGTVNVYGGQFNGNAASGIDLVGDVLTVYGGEFKNNAEYGIGAFFSPATIYGGTFGGNGTADIHSGQSTASVTVYGSDFTYNGISNYYGPLTGTGTFSGVLADTPGLQTISFEADNGGVITLAAAPAATPEPGSVALLVGMASVGAGFLRKRRK